MSRQVRKRSPSGIYHAITRGINKMTLFNDDNDRHKYIDILQKVKQKYDFELYSYCLMKNHVHLLVKELEPGISIVMKSIGIRYSMHFNKKYNRVGFLFQNRFLSEAITSEAQFVTCARYIHNNPVKAGIVANPESYRWSSYRCYLGLTYNPILLMNPLIDYYKGDVALLRSFTCHVNDDQFIGIDSDQSSKDEEKVKFVKTLIADKYGLHLHEIKDLNLERRNMMIREIKGKSDLSYAVIARLLDLSKYIISRA